MKYIVLCWSWKWWRGQPPYFWTIPMYEGDARLTRFDKWFSKYLEMITNE